VSKPLIPDLDETISRLVELGLTLNEARCYVGLLHIAPATAGELAEFSGVPRPKVYGTLKGLEQRSFCYASGDRVTTFRPVDPELALEEWTRAREHDRRVSAERDRQLRADLVRALPRPPEPVVDGPTDVFMELSGGADATIEDYERIIATAERRVDIVHSIPVLQRQPRWNMREAEAVARGVEVRVLFASRELAMEHRYEELIAGGAEVRVARDRPMKLVVRDDGAEAMVALHNPVDTMHPTCLLIRHTDLIAPLQLHFNRQWRQARSLSGIADTSGDEFRMRRPKRRSARDANAS
jgi:sugar-specific transcriptional regulator TrmB